MPRQVLGALRAAPGVLTARCMICVFPAPRLPHPHVSSAYPPVPDQRGCCLTLRTWAQGVPRPPNSCCPNPVWGLRGPPARQAPRPGRPEGPIIRLSGPPLLCLCLCPALWTSAAGHSRSSVAFGSSLAVSVLPPPSLALPGLPYRYLASAECSRLMRDRRSQHLREKVKRWIPLPSPSEIFQMGYGSLHHFTFVLTPSYHPTQCLATSVSTTYAPRDIVAAKEEGLRHLPLPTYPAIVVHCWPLAIPGDALAAIALILLLRSPPWRRP